MIRENVNTIFAEIRDDASDRQSNGQSPIPLEDIKISFWMPMAALCHKVSLFLNTTPAMK